MSTEPQPFHAATAKASSFGNAFCSWLLGALFLNDLARGTVYQGFDALVSFFFASLYLVHWSRTVLAPYQQSKSISALWQRDRPILEALTGLWSTVGKAALFVVVLRIGIDRICRESFRVYQEGLQGANRALLWQVVAIAVAWVLLGVWAKRYQAATASNTPEGLKAETPPVDIHRE